MTTRMGLTVLRIVLGLVVGGYSLLLVVRQLQGHPHPPLVVLGMAELGAAALLLIPRTVRMGGISLIVVFALAALFHVLHRDYDLGFLAVYGAAAFAIVSARTPGMTDDDFIAQLEACTLQAGQFHHRDHLHAAWLYLTRFTTLEAIGRFTEVLRRYAVSLGKPDRYHATITWAYLLVLNERIRRSEPALSWQQFAALHCDLFDWNSSILSTYYWPETLTSEIARHVFVMPDRLLGPPNG